MIAKIRITVMNCRDSSIRPFIHGVLPLISLTLGMSPHVRGQQQLGISPSAVLRQGATLAKAGRYGEAAPLIEQYLRIKPDDNFARYVLVQIDLHANRKNEALAEFKNLQQAVQTPEVEGYIKKLEPQVFPELNAELERSVDRNLAELKGDDAIGVVDEMHLEPQQKELLKYYINRREGSLTKALLRTMTIQATGQSGATAAQGLRDEVTSEAKLFKELMERLDWYRYSAITNGKCTPDWIRKEIPKQNFSMLEYGRLVANAEEHFPLNSWVLDHAFFATLLSKPYEDVESFGDKILEAKGSLRIPFYSRDALFDVVIDVRRRRAYTEADARVARNESGTEEMESLVPFDMSFDQIRGVSQKAQSDLATGGLSKKSYALKIDPVGLAPSYGFMDAMHCLYGEAAQKTITQNLGQFLVHVAGNPRIQAHLADPEKKTVDWLRGTSNAMAIGTLAASEAINVHGNNENRLETQVVARSAMALLAQNKAESQKEGSITAAQDSERKTWHAQLLHTVFSAIEADRVRELAKFEDTLLARSQVP
jgi:hypothetical protein